MSTKNCIYFTTSNKKTISINNNETFGRGSLLNITMSNRISRKTFGFKLIPSQQQHLNNQNNKSLFTLQLFSKYIRINDTEYKTKNKQIIIYENDIINFVEPQFKTEQFSLTVNKLNIDTKTKKRKRESTHNDQNIQKLQNPSKKRKIMVSNHIKPMFKKKPKKTLKQLESAWNSNNISNTNISNKNITNINEPIKQLENNAYVTIDIKISNKNIKSIDSGDHSGSDEDIDIEPLPPTLEFNINSSQENNDSDLSDDNGIIDENENDIKNISSTKQCYSDGVWAMLIPMDMKYKSVLIKSDIFTIGRAPHKDLVLSELNVSGEHCDIVNNNIRNKILLHDWSKNGTYINGKNIKLQNVKEAVLHNGDIISFGQYDQDTVGPETFYYFYLQSLYNNVCNDGNKEFNVRLIHSKSDGKYYLAINDEIVHVYERDVYVNNIAKCIGSVVDIPLDIGCVIGGFFDIWKLYIAEKIAKEIAKRRPKQIYDKPLLCRKYTMCGSPMANNNTNMK